MKSNTISTAYPLHRSGFTLVEVLVAIIVLLVGVVVALRIFPRGFDVLNRTERSMLALEQLERQRMNFNQSPDMLAEAVLPVDMNNLPPQELLTWSDLSAVQIAGYDNPWFQSYLFPVSANQKVWPLWQPLSARIFRRIIGERCVIAGDFSTSDRAVYTPKYLVQFGPIEDASKIAIYDLRYRKVSYGDLQAMMSALSRLPDTLYYAVDYQKGEIYFLPDSTAGTRKVRLAYAAIDGNGKLISSIQSDVTLSNSGLVTVPLGSAVLPGSEQVNREYSLNSAAATDPSILKSGEFYVDAATPGQSLLSGYIYFSRDDVGSTVKIDYTVADWGILHDDVTVDEAGYIQLSFSPKTRNLPVLPRETRSWGIYGPMRNGSVVMEFVNTDSGNLIPVPVSDPDLARPTFDFGSYFLSPDREDHKRWRVVDSTGATVSALNGRHYRVYYRANQDWTMQYFRIPAKMYSQSVNAVTRELLQDEAIGLQAFGLLVDNNQGWIAVPSLYAGHTVAVDYQYELSAGEKDGADDERLLKRIEGEVHVVPVSDKPNSLLMLKKPPAPGTEVRVRGVSVALRAMWSQQSSGKALVIGNGATTTKTTSESWLMKHTMMIVPPGAQ